MNIGPASRRVFAPLALAHVDEKTRMASIIEAHIERGVAISTLEEYLKEKKLRVVAEWRDPETLWQDHVDNASIDAMLENAEQGEHLPYAWYKLPPARIAKAYSAVLNV